MEAALSPATAAPARERAAFRYAPEVAILLVALLFRLLWLDLKPAHFDEGVNGYFVDMMKRQGFYHYDPTNFHGPLHFYILFIAQTLFGRHAWALRLPTALFSLGCVAMALAYRRFFSATTCRLAALAMAVSPAMTFYGRYAIHETFLLLALMATTWGILGLWSTNTRRDLWMLIGGITAMILTKETYAIHLVALALALPATILLEAWRPSGAAPPVPRTWSQRDLVKACGLGGGAILFFYTGGLLDWSSLFPVPEPGQWPLPSLVRTFDVWRQTGADGHGHDKPWHYWMTISPLVRERFSPRTLLVLVPGLFPRYEWPALLGLLASPLVFWPRMTRALRYAVIAGGGTLVAYSIIRYKTPWCILVIMWPFLFAFGFALEAAIERLPRVVPALVAALLLTHSSAQAVRLNFFDYADPTEPYVYVQTLTDINKLLGPLRRLTTRDPVNYHRQGFLLFTAGEDHPLPWLLADFPNARFLTETSPPQKMDADFLMIEDPYVSDVEDRLKERYFRERFTLRGNSTVSGQLYFKPEIFGALFPGREPEFEPFTKLPAE